LLHDVGEGVVLQCNKCLPQAISLPSGAGIGSIETSQTCSSHSHSYIYIYPTDSITVIRGFIMFSSLYYIPINIKHTQLIALISYTLKYINILNIQYQYKHICLHL